MIIVFMIFDTIAIRFLTNPKLSFMYFRVDPEIDESRRNPVPEQV